MNNKKKTFNPLGRGLSELFAEKKLSINTTLDNQIDQISNTESEKINCENFYTKISLKLIKPCATQPRKFFGMEALKELSESIAKNGILQPILVKEKNEDGFYEIIAGERRWRASMIAGLEEIPAIIKKCDEQTLFLFSIIENLQRADLLPIEEIDIYSRLFKNGYTHEEIGLMVSKSRPYITNMLRLDSLSYEIKEMVNSGKLTIGHARALLNAKNPNEIIEQILNKDLSVRQTEELIRKIDSQEPNQTQDKKKLPQINKKQPEIQKTKDPETIELENLVSSSIKNSVSIENDHIRIDYQDFADLDRIVNLLICSAEKVE